MTTTETLKLALEALEICSVRQEHQWQGLQKMQMAEHALREALASEAIEQKSGIKQVIELYDSPDQPAPATELREQEPVGTVRDLFTQTAWENLDVVGSTKVYLDSPLAQRTWVGLTAEERNTICENAGTWREAMKVIEAKLKAKNSL